MTSVNSYQHGYQDVMLTNIIEIFSYHMRKNCLTRET